MRDNNPYRLLRVRRDADDDEIEDAYNRLFDQYEPDAQAGDAAAVSMLEDLNEAHDTLMDPARRAALDRTLPPLRRSGEYGSPAAGRTDRTRLDAGARPGRGAEYASYSARQTRRPSRAGSQKRPRAVVPVEKRSLAPFIMGGVAALVVIVAAAFVVSRGLNGSGLGVNTPAGDVVATVNGEPIYRREFDERLARDKEAALSDPFMAGLINNFQGITGTRMLNVLSYDALDKLVNLEVIQQEAKKEKLYPSDTDKQQLIEQAKAQDLKGQSFGDFLTSHNISEDQYNRSVVVNTVYAIMAGKHMPQQGTDDEKTNGFISWMCKARESYDVKLNLKFDVEGNKPCTSGLPSDVPISGLSIPQQGGTTVPQPEATGPVPTVPQVLPTATPQP